MASGSIFVTADEPLLVFESLKRAVAYLEWQDVEDGIYRGFDGDGRLVKFGSEAIPKSWLGEKRTVAEVESDPTHADELRVILIFDVWNPFLDEGEKPLVNALLKARSEFYSS